MIGSLSILIFSLPLRKGVSTWNAEGGGSGGVSLIRSAGGGGGEFACGGERVLFDGCSGGGGLVSTGVGGEYFGDGGVFDTGGDVPLSTAWHGILYPEKNTEKALYLN